MRKVSVIQRELPHYRIRFFEALYAQGKSQHLDIQVYCAVGPLQRSPLAFPYRVLPVSYFGKKTSSSYWLHGLEEAIIGSDIVVAPQELQCVTVPYLWVRRKRVCKAWIWWGHGYNFQAAVRPSFTTTMKEAVKGFMTRRADGLITYTERGAEYWRQRGFLEDRVMPYYNTIDVEELQRTAAAISEPQRLALRQTLMLEGKRVLLFSGRLYAEKRVDFLLRAFALLKQSCPEAALLIIGEGEERDRLRHLAESLGLHDVHFLGEVVNPKEIAAYFSLADMMVLPSLVGLAIVHGFAFGLPMITTSAPGHGPEIEYLSDDSGAITDFREAAFSRVIQHILNHPVRLEYMRKGARAQADRLRLDRSVGRFLQGAGRVLALCA
jgi:glycosyltransferase involved in cell wall biosynthesis